MCSIDTHNNNPPTTESDYARSGCVRHLSSNSSTHKLAYLVHALHIMDQWLKCLDPNFLLELQFTIIKFYSCLTVVP